MHVLHNNIKGTFYQSESQHIFFKWYASLCAFHIPTYFILIGGGGLLANGQWVVTQELEDQIHKVGIKYHEFSHVK